MDWNTIGAVGEVAGALAVVATLFYLAAQIRSAKVVNRNLSFNAIFDGVSRHSTEMARPENGDILVRGLTDFNGLSGAERFQFDMLMSGFMNYIEMSHRTVTDELLGDNSLDEWAWFFRHRFAPYPGFRIWWEMAHHTWPDEVVKLINEQVKLCDQDEDFYGVKGS